MKAQLYSSVGDQFYERQYHRRPVSPWGHLAWRWFRRRQAVAAELVRRYHRGGPILDIGCGNAVWNRGELPLWGLDLAPGMLRATARRLPGFSGVCCDVRHGLPLGDGCCDLVLLTELLEHLDHPARLVQEVERVLRPGGHVVLSVPYGEPPGLWGAIFPLWSRAKGWWLDDDYYRQGCGQRGRFGPRMLGRLFTRFEPVTRRQLLLLTLFAVYRRQGA